MNFKALLIFKHINKNFWINFFVCLKIHFSQNCLTNTMSGHLESDADRSFNDDLHKALYQRLKPRVHVCMFAHFRCKLLLNVKIFCNDEQIEKRTPYRSFYATGELFRFVCQQNFSHQLWTFRF